MAHGLPVVVSSATYCGIAGLLTHGVNALMLEDPRSGEELGATLRRVLEDRALCASLSSQARHFAGGYRWEDIARQQEAVYRSSLAAPEN
jgi:UDP-glucose:(heptosyl)LPS alpha-1,3-glucosyltransferase